MPLTVYVYATKRGEDTLIAHGGTIHDELWTDSRKDPKTRKRVGAGRKIGEPAKKLGELVKAFDGKDPADLLLATRNMIAATPREDRWLLPYLWDLWLACDHWRKVKEHPRGRELYDQARVVVVSG